MHSRTIDLARRATCPEAYEETDNLAPARGILIALVLSAPFWVWVFW